MKRREFMIAVSGAAGMWAFETSAQQPLLPIIGYMSSRSACNIDPTKTADGNHRHEVPPPNPLAPLIRYQAFEWSDRGELSAL
jgi:hypothetical protein